MASITPDLLDYDGAHELARKLRGYWSARGKHPHIWAEPRYVNQSPQAEERPIWCVRSDMIGGLPRHV